jgi:hypothetical protein
MNIKKAYKSVGFNQNKANDFYYGYRNPMEHAKGPNIKINIRFKGMKYTGD